MGVSGLQHAVAALPPESLQVLTLFLPGTEPQLVSQQPVSLLTGPIISSKLVSELQPTISEH